MKRSCGSPERWFHIESTMAALPDSTAALPAYHSAGSSAKRPAHRSSNVESTMAPLATHNLSGSAQQLAVLQCLEREGWLVTPLLNGCRVAVLSRACKQALEGWPNRLESLKFLETWAHPSITGKLWTRDLVAKKLQWVAHHCSQLRYLVLHPTYPSPDDGNLTEAIQAVARGCSRLKHLDFDGNSVSDAAIEAVAQSCHQLQCLVLADCDVTDVALLAVARGCPKLKELDASLNLVSNAAIEAVAQACPELECLGLAECDITDAALLAVAQGCPKLKELDVSLNFWLTDAAIQAIARACPQLKNLTVAFCNSLRDEAIDSVARGCPQLECLEVIGLQYLTDSAIHAVAQGCPRLKVLDITQCTMLTQSAIVSIARGCTQIEWLKHSMAWCQRWNAIIDGLVPGLGPNAHIWRSDYGQIAIRWH